MNVCNNIFAKSDILQAHELCIKQQLYKREHYKNLYIVKSSEQFDFEITDDWETF